VPTSRGGKGRDRRGNKGRKGTERDEMEGGEEKRRG